MNSTTLILVAVLVLVLVMGSSSSRSSSAPPPVRADPGAGFRPLAPGETLYLPPGSRPAPSPGIVDRCHQGFTAGTAAVSSAYGAPKSAASIGAKVNPYYYACDAGGIVVKGAEKVVNWVGGLF